MLFIQRPSVEEVGEEIAGRQKFAIGPLEPGFGHTLGNSLRRILLSSIPGAAITEVRFDDALHEFTTLPGIKEDVTEIILNLKDVVFRSESDEAVEIRLDVRGPGVVRAGDFQVTADIDVINPDLQIATLSDKGRLALDAVVEKGKGYQGADSSRSSGVIGRIPVDAIFAPIRRVSINVEATAGEQSRDYDRLTLDIETDGSISPREALASAGETLRGLATLIAEMSDQPQGLALTETAAIEVRSPDLDLPIEDLELTERPRNCLKRAQINTIGELLSRSADDLLAITNFGQKSLDEVVGKLTERGLQLRKRD
ncbi:MAG: DNA-directed RNA polymerase subunit alpha [Nitrospiraceae bacterium]|nr:DNA-directed RNA polymerase subunit alpha [Nitrospiraceae bacterium]MDA8373849.1 DNA-directed RNA polymerase subunit alpha [Actinomycetota bacterium]